MVKLTQVFVPSACGIGLHDITIYFYRQDIIDSNKKFTNPVFRIFVNTKAISSLKFNWHQWQTILDKFKDRSKTYSSTCDHGIAKRFVNFSYHSLLHLRVFLKSESSLTLMTNWPLTSSMIPPSNGTWTRSFYFWSVRSSGKIVFHRSNVTGTLDIYFVFTGYSRN